MLWRRALLTALVFVPLACATGPDAKRSTDAGEALVDCGQGASAFRDAFDVDDGRPKFVAIVSPT